MAETMTSLADDVLIDGECIRTIAHSLHDLEHQYMSCRTDEQRGWLRSILLDRLQEESDGLARKAKRLRTQLRPASSTQSPQIGAPVIPSPHVGNGAAPRQRREIARKAARARWGKT